MNRIDPSLSRYRTLHQNLERYPADRDGMRMNLQHRDVPELGGTMPPSSRIDNDPSTHDIINFSSRGDKSGHTYENFVEMPATRTFWGRPKTNQQLVHLSRRVTHSSSGMGLSDIVLRTVDLLTGEPLSEVTGPKALKQAQDLEKQIPFRLHVHPEHVRLS
jgi:hypothetical protein